MFFSNETYLPALNFTRQKQSEKIHRILPTSMITDQGARGEIKKEQGAKRYEKGAVKIGKKEQAPENRREQGE